MFNFFIVCGDAASEEGEICHGMTPLVAVHCTQTHPTASNMTWSRGSDLAFHKNGPVDMKSVVCLWRRAMGPRLANRISA